MKISAIDLGSGTIKFSAFEKHSEGWREIALDEENTELRRGMGSDWLLQPEPIKDTLAAVEAFVAKAHELGLPTPPAYGTSALRKARNREKLFGPLKDRFGIEAALLSEEDEGRLNLYGCVGAGRWPARRMGIVVDPGGDSTDCAWGPDWKTAATASLPFGSVSLQEAFGREKPGDPIPQEALEALKLKVKADLDKFGPAQALKKSGMLPAIRMNAPIAKALTVFAGGGRATDSPLQGSREYLLDNLRMLTLIMAAMPHESRAALIAGEPVGKVDRTPFGFASWVALLEWMNAGTFVVEPYGIKLGAALVLNGINE